MPKKAFVVMPYAQKYNRLYSLIIERTLKEMDYIAVGESYRQDRTGEGGVVMNSVIKKIAEADIIICVLSGWNWNVAYEIGIAHAMNRFGTILICDKEDEENCPFDVKHLNILYYNTDWMEMESENEIIDELKKRISRVGRAGMSDSPVHSVYPKFPEKLLSLTEGDQSSQTEKLGMLEKENKELRLRIKKAGLDEEVETHDDVETAIMQAIDDRIYYSDAAVNKLREFQSAGEVEKFGRFLAQVLMRGFLDEDDCRSVYFLCEKLKAPSLTRLFLERVVKQYPENEELNIFLAEKLAEMPQTRDNALIMANEMIGLSRKNGKYELSSKHVTRSALAAFMDVYIKLDRYEEILKIVPVLLAEYKKTETQCMLYRNVVSAYLHFEKFSDAEEICRKLLRMDAENSRNYYSVFMLYRQTDRSEQAYEALENCIYFDPKNIEYYFSIAGLIFDENVARTDCNSGVHRVDDEAAKKYALSFIFSLLTSERFAGSITPDIMQRIMAFLRFNKCNRLAEMLTSDPKFIYELDYDMVEYCYSKKITPMFSDQD